MERNWYLRIALIAGVLVFSVYQLVPSWYYFRLPPEKRNGQEYEESVPGWAPSARKHLNLGLDLQGGIHLAMGVDVDRAVKAKVARRADESADFLREKKIPVEASAPTAAGGRSAVKTSESKQVESIVLDQYGNELTSPSGAPAGTVYFAFKGRAIQDFQAKAVEQAEKTIRNRGDKWGVSEPDIKRKGNNQIQIQLPGFKDPEKAKELLGRTAQLEFKIAADDSAALDPLRATLPQCPADRSGPRLPLPEGGCWLPDPVQLPNGGSRVATMLVANSRNELEKLIQTKAEPLLDPQKNA